MRYVISCIVLATILTTAYTTMLLYWFLLAFEAVVAVGGGVSGVFDFGGGQGSPGEGGQSAPGVVPCPRLK